MNYLKNLDSITYAHFGIDPSIFYRQKFCGLPNSPDYLKTKKNLFDIEYDRVRFLVANVYGNRVLDIGCGSAPFGNTIRNNAAVNEIYGLDLDPECIKIARSQYDFADAFDLNSKLPFQDEYFDCVFSMDVFGHIEFRHKDNLLQEIYRVTKRGGRSVHGIECGVIDYFSANPTDPGCPITNYVKQEGHVGIEDSYALKSRWDRFFSNVIIENAFIWPLLPFASIKSLSLSSDINDILEKFDQSQIDAIQVVLGFLHNELRTLISKETPHLLFPNEKNVFSKHSGFVYLIADKK